jgi:hypothetical protein
MDLILTLNQKTLKLVYDELYRGYLESIRRSKFKDKDKLVQNSLPLTRITAEEFTLAVMTVITPPEIFAHSPRHHLVVDNNGEGSFFMTQKKGFTFQINTAEDAGSVSEVSSPKLSRAANTGISDQLPTPTSPKRTGTTVANERRHHRLQQTAQTLRKIFDLVDIDHHGYVSWTDITNYCIRAGNFAFRGSISQSSTIFTRIEGLSSSISAIPTRNLYHIPRLDFLLATDSVQSSIRIYKSTTGNADGNSIKIHGIYHPHKEFTRKILQSAGR